MSKTSAPPSFSVRELARQRFDALEKGLRRETGAVNAAIHDARRDLKKLRALLRLVRPHFGEPGYTVENESLKVTGRLLAPLRDAWVRLTLTEHLREDPDAGSASRALGTVVRHLREDYAKALLEHPPERLLPEAAAGIAAARMRLPDWPEPGGDPLEVCRPGLKDIYGRGRSRLLSALCNPTVAHLHELRKRTKDLRYQLEFLNGFANKPFRDLVSALRKLTDALGSNHDVAVLREAIEAGLSGSLPLREILALHERLETRSRASMDAAIAIGCDVFSAKPKEFAAGLEERWKKGRAA